MKNYLRSSLTQDHVCDFCIIAIEKRFTKSMSSEDIIDKFAAAKCRKHHNTLFALVFLCCTLCVVYYIFCVVYICPINEAVQKFYSIFNLLK